MADGSKSLLGTTSKDHKVHKQLVKEAKLLKQKWTDVIERRVELKEEGSKIDVKLDAISAGFRNKAVSLMLEAVNSKFDNANKSGVNSENNAPDEDSKSNILMIIELVEKYLFVSNNKRTNNSYRKSVRKLTFDLKNNKHDLREQLIEHRLDELSYKSVARLIKDHLTNTHNT